MREGLTSVSVVWDGAGSFFVCCMRRGWGFVTASPETG